jgi:tetratricopeptide (TPR) repeat protein
LFRYGRDKKIPVSDWYRARFGVWYGRQLLHLNRLEESKKYLKEVAAMAGIPPKYKYAAYFFLGEMAVVTGNRNYRWYYQQGLTILLNKKNKALSERYDIGILLFKMKHYERCEKWFKNMLRSKPLPSKILSGIYLFIGDIKKQKGDRRWKDYYAKGVDVLVRKRHKTVYDKYRVASFFKRMNHFEKANQWFRGLLDTEKDMKILTGVYFHLGEMAYFREQYASAAGYFQKCVEANPLHKKAKEYIEKMRSEETKKRR